MTPPSPTTVAPHPTAPTSRANAGQVPHELFIAGHWQPAAGPPMPVVNPVTEHVFAEVADASVADARRALRAAADAQSPWAATPARERSRSSTGRTNS